MLLLFLFASIVTIVVGTIVKYKKDIDLGDMTQCAGVIFTVIFAIAVGVVTVVASNSYIVDDKISLYENENAKIESQIEQTVSEYKNYEQDTYKKLKGNISAMVAMYPELKSDTLVQEQMKLYVSNNKSIKELKSDKLNYKLMGWWLYFGS